MVFTICTQTALGADVQWLLRYTWCATMSCASCATSLDTVMECCSCGAFCIRDDGALELARADADADVRCVSYEGYGYLDLGRHEDRS